MMIQPWFSGLMGVLFWFVIYKSYIGVPGLKTLVAVVDGHPVTVLVPRPPMAPSPWHLGTRR